MEIERGLHYNYGFLAYRQQLTTCVASGTMEQKLATCVANGTVEQKLTTCVASGSM